MNNRSSSQNSVSRATQIKECENQAKFVQQRVNGIESFFGDLCAELVAYTRRTAKLRNNGDEISRILLDYSVKEQINRSSAQTLKRLSEHLATVEDYRHTEIDRLVGKVVNPLASYGEEIKKVRANLKTENIARKKEIAQMKKLERSTTAEATRIAQIQLHNAIIDANQSADKLERCVLDFEGRRLKGLKNILGDFIQVEMLWHAKALETLTDAYNVLQNMREEEDMVEFRNTLMRSAVSTLSVNMVPGRNVAGDTQGTTAPGGMKNYSVRSSANTSTPRAGQQPQRTPAEDANSLFTDEDDEDEGEESEHVRHRKSGNEIEDLEDEETEDEDEDEEEDDEDDEDELISSARSGGNQQITSNAKPHSPLKSALKSSGSKKLMAA
ncbi:unnamed protein product [Calicophoron daubneyi]|uniref:Protein FAM92A1 n=1 Tax=Calicophoron daubneyi TaxID=300641 RepID=A0AAV2TUQ3_CALDB